MRSFNSRDIYKPGRGWSGRPVAEFFPYPLEATVIKQIALYEPGRVKVAGDMSWQARLYAMNCQTPLKVGQPVHAIARKGNTLYVIPLHCLLWNQYIDEYCQVLTDADIAIMHHYETFWRAL